MIRKIFSHPIGQMLLALVALGLVVYFVAPFLGLDDAWRAVLLVEILAVLGILAYKIRCWLADRKLSGKLEDQGKDDGGSSEEIEALKESFQQAFEELARQVPKRRIFGAGPGGHLPWIVLIGPPGAGKTSALQKSGLQFSALGRRVSGFGGTRNCVWWLAEEAIFIDTAGRYSIRREDHDEWIGFLDLLRKYRKRHPIDATILQVGLDELENLSPAEVEEVALELQQRLDELIRHLGVRFPVHLVFSKCDRLDGFQELFSMLGTEERRRVWGFSLDVDNVQEQGLGTEFDVRFEQLVDALRTRVATRVHTAAGPETRLAAMTLPRELMSKREKLRTFTEILFAPSRHREQPWLTGVYLLSATQEGDLLAGVREAMAQNLGLPPPSPTPLNFEPSPYFVRGFFRRAIEQATEAARPTAQARRKLIRKKRIALAVAAFLAMLSSWVFTDKYMTSRAWIGEVTKAGRKLVSSPIYCMDSLTRTSFNLEMAHQEALLEKLVDGPPGPMVRPTYEEASRLLQERVDKVWVVPMSGPLNRRLRDVSRWKSGDPGEAYADGYFALKTDFVLQRKRCEGAKPESTSKWFSSFFVDLWTRELGDRSTPVLGINGPRSIQKTLAFFLRSGGRSKLQFDDTFRIGAEKALKREDAGDEVLFYLVIANAGLTSVENQLEIDSVVVDAGLKEAYTPQGCNKFESAIEEDREWWTCVLDARNQDVKERERIYKLNYRNALSGWFNRLEWKQKPRKVEEVLKVVKSFRGRELNAIFRVMAGHVPEKKEAIASEKDVSGIIRMFWAGFGWFAQLFKRTGEVVQTSTGVSLDMCHESRSQFNLFDQALDPEGSAKVSAAYATYQLALEGLEQRLQAISMAVGTKQNAMALELVEQGMGAEGPMVELRAQRGNLLSALRNTPAEPDGFDRLLQTLEIESAGALIPFAAQNLQDLWKKDVVNDWQTLLTADFDNVTKQCEQRKSYLKDYLVKFVDSKLTQFYKGSDYSTCELEEIMGHEMPLDETTCRNLNTIRRLLLTARCPKEVEPQEPTPPPPPPPPPLPKSYNWYHDIYNSCPENRVARIKVDTGEEAVECEQTTGKCSSKSSRGRAEVLFHRHNDTRDWTLAAEARDFQSLVGPRWERDRIEIRISDNDCPGLTIGWKAVRPKRHGPGPQPRGQDPDPFQNVKVPARIIN